MLRREDREWIIEQNDLWKKNPKRRLTQVETLRFAQIRDKAFQEIDDLTFLGYHLPEKELGQIFNRKNLSETYFPPPTSLRKKEGLLQAILGSHPLEWEDWQWVEKRRRRLLALGQYIHFDVFAYTSFPPRKTERRGYTGYWPGEFEMIVSIPVTDMYFNEFNERVVKRYYRGDIRQAFTALIMEELGERSGKLSTSLAGTTKSTLVGNIPIELFNEFIERVVDPYYGVGGVSMAIIDLMKKAVQEQKEKYE